MKGIFTVEQEQKLAGMLDDAVKMKGLLEIVDGYLFKGIITIVDNEYIDRLNEEVKLQLQKLATACIDEDVDEAAAAVVELANSLIDIPMLDETSEGLIFKGAVDLILGAVMKWIESKE